MKAEQIKLLMTCGACPEQYEAFLCGRKVGYLRLRWGEFSVRVPDELGREVYAATTGGQYDGTFGSQEDRVYHLDRAKKAIAQALTGSPA